MKYRIKEMYFGGFTTYIVQYRKFFIWFNDKRRGIYGDEFDNDCVLFSTAKARVEELRNRKPPYTKYHNA